VIEVQGELWGRPAEVAAELTSPERSITIDTVHDWARRSRRVGDRLYGRLPSVRLPGARTGTAWVRLADAVEVEALTARGGL
jgi:hypothetical protein